MPYSTNADLPDKIKRVLPAHAQDIFREAYNSAYQEYKDPKDRQGNADHEETANRVAWAAVKKKYKKGEDDTWHPIT